MTSPSDIAGLSERLRFDAVRCEVAYSKGVASNIEEAAAALGSLSARVKELEAELFDTQATLGGVNRDWNKAMDRALRAEQQRDEAYERLKAFAAGSLDVSGAAIIIGYPGAETALKAARDLVRRLASGPDNGAKP